jgi:prepilin signal peptidase PulO-like enzyme (type II secretory pathway)
MLGGWGMGRCPEDDAVALIIFDSFLAFIVGASLASHIGLVISRKHSGEQFLTGRSRCEQCGRLLAFWEVIPFFGWVLCRGKCRVCGYRIPVKHLALETLSGAIVSLLFLLVTKICW